MSRSVLNQSENEAVIVLGRPLTEENLPSTKVEALVAAVDAWAAKLSLPLGLVYCGTTQDWPSENYARVLIGLVTCNHVGDDDESEPGSVGPAEMDLSKAAAISEEFWSELASSHEVEFEGENDVYLAAAGWTWTSLHADGERVLGVSTEDDGCIVIPEALRSKTLQVRAGYC